MSETENDEFFIGWQANQPVAMRRVVRLAVCVLLFSGVVLALVFAASQRMPDLSAYEWSNVRTFEGILKKAPYPHLLVERDSGGDFSAYTLVAPTKFGIPAEWCGDLDGRPVHLDGGLIFRGGGTMIEVVSEAPVPAEDEFFRLPANDRVDFGTQTLVGEIVDAKCFLGAMNPGRYKPHRACAAMCISGGIPAMLVVNTPGGTIATFLLVGPDGEMINRQLLPLLARPVRITGQLSVSNNRWILSTDPEAILQL
jgi:hypothetical protein